MTAQTQTPRARRKETYHQVLRIVAHNTGGHQPPLVRLSAVKIAASHAGLDAKQVEKAIQAARENGDLLADPDGERVARTDAASLRAIIETEVERDEPRTELIAACNRRLREQGGER